MKLEVGMHVRLQNDVENIVIINRIANVFETTILTANDGSIYQGEYTKENVIKASYNIIDILEVGDYVNGLEVDRIIKRNRKIEPSTMIYCKYGNNFIGFYNDEIKSVITHEQMRQIAYKVGE